MGVIKPVSKKVKQNKMILANTQIDAPFKPLIMSELMLLFAGA